jgi:PAS domain-containing protein
MSNRIQTLIGEIKNLEIREDQSERFAFILDELKRINSEYDKMTFKYERSGKEKNIFSSLLTRTSFDLKKVSDNLKTRAEELSTLLTTIPAYVYFKDTRLNYVMVNQPFEELIGISGN